MTPEQMDRLKILAEKLLNQTANDSEVDEYLSLMKLWNFDVENQHVFNSFFSSVN